MDLYVDSKDNVWASTYAGVLKISGYQLQDDPSEPDTYLGRRHGT